MRAREPARERVYIYIYIGAWARECEDEKYVGARARERGSERGRKSEGEKQRL